MCSCGTCFEGRPARFCFCSAGSQFASSQEPLPLFFKWPYASKDVQKTYTLRTLLHLIQNRQIEKCGHEPSLWQAGSVDCPEGTFLDYFEAIKSLNAQNRALKSDSEPEAAQLGQEARCEAAFLAHTAGTQTFYTETLLYARTGRHQTGSQNHDILAGP